jgi:hypothetical protein
MRQFIENKIEKMSNETPQQNFLDKIDTTLIGFILGLILPLIMYELYHQIKYSDATWEQYVNVTKNMMILPSIIKVCVFINLPFFMLFNILKKFNICKGLGIASLLYIIAMLVIKFVL